MSRVLEESLRDAARERLLTAAVGLAERAGPGALGIAAVAREAGVSRPTVYRYFADRDALVRETTLRIGAAFGQALRTRLAALETPAERALAAVDAAADELPDHPVLGPVLAANIDAITDPDGIAIAGHALAPLVEAAGWKGREAREAIETSLRFAASLATSPLPRRDRRARRRFLERRLLPALGLDPPR
jgi:AcrR family transcriptional regulator